MKTEAKIKKELSIQDALNYLDRANIKYEKVDNPTAEELSFLTRYFEAKNNFFNNMKTMLNIGV